MSASLFILSSAAREADMRDSCYWRINFIYFISDHSRYQYLVGVDRNCLVSKSLIFYFAYPKDEMIRKVNTTDIIGISAATVAVSGMRMNGSIKRLSTTS